MTRLGLIKENIEYITEELSVSDEVLAITDKICESITINWRNYQKEEDKPGLEKLYGHEVYSLMGYNFDINVTIYNYTDKSLFNRDIENVPLFSSFDAENQALNLNLVMENGFLYREYTDAVICHEVLHMYQWCHNKFHNPRFRKLTNQAYQYSGEVLSHSNNSIERKLAYLMYYANPREQDAFVHEFYVLSKQSPDDFYDGRTTVDNRLEQFENLVRWYQFNIDQPGLKPFLKEYGKFGYTPENILSYVTKGLKRFQEKIEHATRRVYGEFTTRVPLIDEEREYIKKIVAKGVKKALDGYRAKGRRDISSWPRSTGNPGRTPISSNKLNSIQ